MYKRITRNTQYELFNIFDKHYVSQNNICLLCYIILVAKITFRAVLTECCNVNQLTKILGFLRPHIRITERSRVVAHQIKSNQIEFIEHTSNVYASIEFKRKSKIYNSLNRQ